MTSHVHDDALAYARRGWAVFPVEPRGKRPACPRGKDDATAHADELAAMFRRPDLNIGIAVERAGLVVVDVDDDDRGGGATFATLVAELGPLPPTITTDTPSGGAHYVFRSPQVDLRGKAGRGVDVIARGYIVAPPSVHPTGRRYRWRAGCAPGERELADLPDTWLARLRQPASTLVTIPIGALDLDRNTTMRRATAYLARMPASISGQRGHDALWTATVALVRGFDLDPDDALALLARDFSPRCLPPWSERELRHKVADASNANVPRGYLLDPEAVTVPHWPGVLRVTYRGGRMVVGVSDDERGREAGRGALAAIRRSGFDLARVEFVDVAALELQDVAP